MKLHRRSYGYAFLVVVLVVVAGWVARVTWQELRQLHQSFGSVEDSFHLAEHIEASIREANEVFSRFDLRQRGEDRAVFEKQSQHLQEWIRAKQPTVTTTSELELLGQIKETFGIYSAQVIQLMDERAQKDAGRLPDSVIEQVQNRVGSILELCEKLAAAERSAHTQFMNHSRGALGWLEELLVVQLMLLLVLVGTAIIAVYRGVIGPLRVELGQSRARAARHEKLASLGTLAAGVAHEIRNPLTAINVRLHGLNKRLPANSSEQEDAQVIGYEIQRLERIVKEFLQFARPADPKFLTVSVDSLLGRMQALFGPQLEKTSMQLNVESVPDTWVRVDPHQIEQVLINLIQNAVESLDGKGTITLRVRTESALLHGRTGPGVRLEVSDTGRGILPEVRKRIFDPFFTTKEGGTGLGLAIAARILEKHGGTLECRSEVNRGTTFVILLPLKKPEDPDEAPT